jgi:hypothetical protein
LSTSGDWHFPHDHRAPPFVFRWRTFEICLCKSEEQVEYHAKAPRNGVRKIPGLLWGKFIGVPPTGRAEIQRRMILPGFVPSAWAAL